MYVNMFKLSILKFHIIPNVLYDWNNVLFVTLTKMLLILSRTHNRSLHFVRSKDFVPHYNNILGPYNKITSTGTLCTCTPVIEQILYDIRNNRYPHIKINIYFFHARLEKSILSVTYNKKRVSFVKILYIMNVDVMNALFPNTVSECNIILLRHDEGFKNHFVKYL